jgi:hypothetical protein
MPDVFLSRSQLALNYAQVGRWMRNHGFVFPVQVRNRKSLFQAIAREAKGHGRILYLEFGVHKGAATRYWTQLIEDRNASFHGFDSFEGLPETFDDFRYRKGHFNTDGVVPDLHDPRVTFHKGWFHETLADFDVPEHDVLVIVMDADLYSSTRIVFDRLKDHIRNGTIVYFDEFQYVEHEARAFDEFITETGKSFEGLAAEVSLNRCAFKCLG